MFLTQVLNQIVKVVQWLARHEELRIVLHKVGTVFFDIEALPGLSGVLDRLTLLGVVVTAAAHFTLTLRFVALLALGLAFIVGLSVDKTLPHGEVGLDFFLGRDGALHPGVGVDLLNGGPVGWVKSHHFLK